MFSQHLLPSICTIARRFFTFCQDKCLLNQLVRLCSYCLQIHYFYLTTNIDDVFYDLSSLSGQLQGVRSAAACSFSDFLRCQDLRYWISETAHYRSWKLIQSTRSCPIGATVAHSTACMYLFTANVF